MTMFESLNPLATSLFGLGCFGAGALAIYALRLRRRRPYRPLSDYRISPDLDARLGDAARSWSSERGRPGAARLAHHRLRTLVRAEQRRNDRRWSR